MHVVFVRSMFASLASVMLMISYQLKTKKNDTSVYRGVHCTKLKYCYRNFCYYILRIFSFKLLRIKVNSVNWGVDHTINEALD